MILSASRRTDIPAYFSDWFLQRIRESYVLVRNPMNSHQISRVNLSPEYVDCIVFWTKNPKSILDKLDQLKDYSYYFQFTLNAYGKDVELNIPSKDKQIIDTFKRLSDTIGREKVLWRYDPVFFNEKYTMSYHIQYFEKLARRLKDHTEKCTISFFDYYPKIKKKVASLNIQFLQDEQKREFAKHVSEIAFAYGLRMDTCAEEIDLVDLGIEHASCIDDKLIHAIQGLPVKRSKDTAQRLACGCVTSIDIGAYDTCKSGCMYCYANHSLATLGKNILNYDQNAPLLCSRVRDSDKIFDRALKLLKKKPENLLFDA